MGFTEVLTLIFILLKIFKIIDWSWFLVLSPEIIVFGLYIIFLICTVIQTHRIEKDFDDFWGNDK